MDLRSRFQPDTGDLAGISLCAGYGGLDLGLHIAEPNYRTVCFVEREAHAAATLLARMEDEALGEAAVWSDLRTFDGRPWRDRVHLISAGYPCQPFSVAGQRRGASDPRHLWPEVARVVGEVRPRWVFCENVEGHVDMGLADVAADLARLGYRTKAGLFSAAEAGARHRRHRIFILAHADSEGQRPLPRSRDRGRHDHDQEGQQHHRPIGRASAVAECGADMDRRLAGAEGNGVATSIVPLFAPGPGELGAWFELLALRPDLQPALLRSDDGVADRVDRSRGAGNGVCSMAAAIAWAVLKTAFLTDA